MVGKEHANGERETRHGFESHMPQILGNILKEMELVSNDGRLSADAY